MNEYPIVPTQDLITTKLIKDLEERVDKLERVLIAVGVSAGCSDYIIREFNLEQEEGE